MYFFFLQFNIELIQLTQMCRFDIRRKGSNTISPSEFGEARRYCSERLNESVDITIVTGQFWA